MNKLKELRNEKKCTQLDVANFLNIARTTYSAYEQGANEPDFDTLIKLSKYFNKSIDYLIGNEIDEKLDLTALTNEQRNTIEIIQKLNQENCKLLNAYANGLMEAQKKQDELIKKFTNLN